MEAGSGKHGGSVTREWARTRGVAALNPSGARRGALEFSKEAGVYYEVLLGVGDEAGAARVAESLLLASRDAQGFGLLVRHARRAGADEVADAMLARARDELDHEEQSKLRTELGDS